MGREDQADCDQGENWLEQGVFVFVLRFHETEMVPTQVEDIVNMIQAKGLMTAN